MMGWHWSKRGDGWPKLKRGGTNDGKEEKEQHIQYAEHCLPPAQLADLFPLARIESGNLVASRGISQEEARLRLAEGRRLRRRLFAPFFVKFAGPLLRRLLPSSLDLLCSFRLPLLISSFLLFLFLPTNSSPQSAASLLPVLLLQLAALLFTTFVAVYARWRGAKRMEETAFGIQPFGQKYTAIREGSEVAIRGDEILVGDLLLLRQGQRMAADVRILKILDGPLMADCGWLCTDAEPVEFTDSTAPKHLREHVLQARNILFAGFLCTQGSALGLAIRIGKQTLLSRLSPYASSAAPSSSSSPPANSLRRNYQKMLQFCLLLSLGLSLLAFLLFLLLLPPPSSVDPFPSTFVHTFLLLFIALLPHALPIAWTMQHLWISRRLMQKCGGIVLRRMEAADALGQTDVLMIHNTTVLSTNRPVLTDLWLASSNRQISTGELVDWAVRQRQKATANGGGGPKEVAENFGEGTMEMLRVAAFCCRAPKNEREEKPKAAAPLDSIWASVRRSKRGTKVSDSDGDGGPNGIIAPKRMPQIGQLAHQALEKKEEEPTTATLWTDPMDGALAKFLGQLMPMEVLLKGGPELLETVQQGGPEGPLLAYVQLDEGKMPAKCRVMARGAPEELLQICSTITVEEEGGHLVELPLTDEHLVQFECQFLRFSAQSKRCLALITFNPPNDFVPSLPGLSRSASTLSALSTGQWSDSTGQSGRWSFLGLLAFSDPPSTDCAAKMRELEGEGVRVVLASDDHPALVQAMAKMVGMDGEEGEGRGRSRRKGREDVERADGGEKVGKKWTKRATFPRLHKTHSSTSSGYHSSEIVFSGTKMGGPKGMEAVEAKEKGWPIEGVSLAEMDVDSLDQLLIGPGHLAFSRLVSPLQIVHLIKRFQAKGQSVTFIGQNGLLDGQALRDADLGIADAHSAVPGSLLAQQAADALGSDLGLANILRAIRETRAIRQNLASILAYSLSHLPALFLPFLLTPLLGLPPALSPLQVISISFLFALFPSIGLIFTLPASPSTRPSLLSPSLLIHSLLLSGPILALASFFAFLTVFWQANIGIGDLLGSAGTFWQPNSPNMTILAADGVLLKSDQQIAISQQAAAAWQISLVLAQLINVWLCADRHQRNTKGIWSRLAIFRRNMAPLWLALLLNVFLLLSLVYLPALNTAFRVQPPPAGIWLLFPVAACLGLFALNLLHKLIKLGEWPL